MKQTFALVAVVCAVVIFISQIEINRQQHTNYNCQKVCVSPTTALYTSKEIDDIERGASKFQSSLSKDNALLYDRMNLRKPVGLTIYDELRHLAEPNCTIEGSRECFHHWKPLFKCKDMMYVGGYGDGSRLLCSSSTYVSRPHCIIYAIGSFKDFSFEVAILRETRSCVVHTFDCTLNGAYNDKPQGPFYNSSFEIVKGRHWFHPWCLSSTTGFPDKNYKSLSTIHSLLGHKWGDLSLLKMDIEAFEHDVFDAFDLSDKSFPEQINIEIHSTTVPISGKYRYKSFTEMTLLLLHFMRFGYRLVYSTYEGGGIGATFIRTLC